jgi:hypothetical protein
MITLSIEIFNTISSKDIELLFQVFIFEFDEYLLLESWEEE